MTQFSLVVKVPEQRFQCVSRDLHEAVSGMIDDYEGGMERSAYRSMFNTYIMSPEWVRLFPVDAKANPESVLQWCGHLRSSALLHEALDIDHVRSAGVRGATDFYRLFSTNMCAMPDRMGCPWTKVLRESLQADFATKYALCFTQFLPAAIIDESGWSQLAKQNNSPWFWLGTPDEALERVRAYEEKVLTCSNPRDVLVLVSVDRPEAT